MKLLSPMTVTTSYLWDAPIIRQELLIRSGFHVRVKGIFGFTTIDVPQDVSEGVIVLKEAFFESGGKKFFVERLEIGNSGCRVEMRSDTATARKFLDALCLEIDALMLFESLQKHKRTESHSTRAKVKLDIDLKSAFHKSFLSLLEQFGPQLCPPGFTPEIHPFSIGVSFVPKPKAGTVPFDELTTVELSRLFENISSCALTLRVPDVADYRAGSFMVQLDADSDAFIDVLESLEKGLTR